MTNAYEELKTSRAHALQCMTPTFQESFEAVSEEVRAMNELELTNHFAPTPNDYALRKRLWELVSIPGTSGIGIEVLAGGIVSHQTISIMKRNPHKLMWILTPLESFEEMYEQTFYALLSKIRKFVASNEVNSRNIGSMMQLYDRLENRVLGPVAKNINIRTQKIQPSQAGLKNVTPAELDERIKELEGKSTTANLLDSKDVMPE